MPPGLFFICIKKIHSVPNSAILFFFFIYSRGRKAKLNSSISKMPTKWSVKKGQLPDVRRKCDIGGCQGLQSVDLLSPSCLPCLYLPTVIEKSCSHHVCETRPGPPTLISLTVFHSLPRLSYPFGLQHGQKRHGPSPRGLCPGQRRSLWVGMSPAHVGQRGEAPAQDGGGPAPAAIPASHRPLLRTRVQPAGGKDQRLEATSVICEVAFRVSGRLQPQQKAKTWRHRFLKGPASCIFEVLLPEELS